MSRQLAYSLVADGKTDRALVPILQWAIHRLDPDVDILEPEFQRRTGPLCDYLASYQTGSMLVFAHRDAERESFDERLREFDGLRRNDVVAVIPVRMTEAWLLIDAAAIARAADRPDASVSLPAPGDLESTPNPKATLDELLLTAAGALTGRRRKQFVVSLPERRANLATLISDFSPLERLPAFQMFQATLRDRYPYQRHLVDP